MNYRNSISGHPGGDGYEIQTSIAGLAVWYQMVDYYPMKTRGWTWMATRVYGLVVRQMIKDACRNCPREISMNTKITTAALQGGSRADDTLSSGALKRYQAR